MFLTRLVGALRRRLHSDEEGVALAAVLGIFAVAIILSSVILSSITSGLGQTSSTRASVQSQAAADAGIAVAQASLLAGTCVANSNGNYVSAAGVAPEYSASIWRARADGSWEQGCPASVAGSVRILSGGTAASLGVSGNTLGDESTVEAIFSVPTSPTTVQPSGPAVYSYSTNGFGGSGNLQAADGSIPNVFVKSGNINCSGGAAMKGNLVVYGNVELSGSCGVTGSLWATGTVKLTGGVQVGGNLIGSAVTINSGGVGGTIWSPGVTSLSSPTVGGSVVAGPLTLTDGSVLGSVWSSGAATIASNVSGNISAVSVNVTRGSVLGNIWATGPVNLGAVAGGNVSGGAITFSGSGGIAGNAWSTGTITIGSGQIIYGYATATGFVLNEGQVRGRAWTAGNAHIVSYFTNPGAVYAKSTSGGGGATPLSVTPGGTPTSTKPPAAGAAPAAPPVIPTPVIPEWVDFDYRASDWSGFVPVTMSGACSHAEIKAALLGVGASKAILDLRACANGITLDGSNTLNLANDLVVVAKKFDLNNGGFTATGTHKLWLITPDTQVTSPTAPLTCGVDRSFIMTGGFSMAETISTMVYTPCKISIASGIHLRGQIYAGAASIDGGATMTYRGIGLPGIDLGTGTSTPPSGTPSTWTLSSIRNVVFGG
jgi:hypothetical protein